MRLIKFIGLFLILNLSLVSVMAQEDCRLSFEAAISDLNAFCAEQATGTACLGSPGASIQAEAQVGGFQFSGDRVELDQIDVLATVNTSKDWATSRILTQAYAPTKGWQSLPLVLVAYGDTALQNLGTENRSMDVLDLTITAVEGANLRSGTGTGFPVISSLLKGDRVKAIAYTDSGWIRVLLPSGKKAWLGQGAVEQDFSDLPRVDENTIDEEVVLWASFQRLNLLNEENEDDCNFPDGLLVQLQDDSETLYQMEVNGLHISLNGSLYIHALADDLMEVAVLEGRAEIENEFGAVEIGAGFSSFVMTSPLMEDGWIETIAAPYTARPYDYEYMLLQPLDTLLAPVLVALDLSKIIRPRPADGSSPLADMPLDAACTITVGEGGVFLRSGPGGEYVVRGILDYRESAQPIGRAFASDGLAWWKLAENVWIKVEATVTGGDCFAVPQLN